MPKRVREKSYFTGKDWLSCHHLTSDLKSITSNLLTLASTSSTFLITLKVKLSAPLTSSVMTITHPSPSGMTTASIGPTVENYTTSSHSKCSAITNLYLKPTSTSLAHPSSPNITITYCSPLMSNREPKNYYSKFPSGTITYFKTHSSITTAKIYTSFPSTSKIAASLSIPLNL